MHYEVEQKFVVDAPDELESRLVRLGAKLGPPVTQVDRYYAHPARNFAETDEALRIRQVGGDLCITYKGPKIDAQTKTRREIELPLGSGKRTLEQWDTLLGELGFAHVAEVHKQRRQAEIVWEDEKIILALDNVHNLGTFVEIELAADEATLDAARSKVASLAMALELTQGERRGYLDLLLVFPDSDSDG